MRKNKSIIAFIVVTMFFLVILVSCKQENEAELVIWDKNIDGVAVSPLPEIESAGGSDGIVGYKNRAAFSGELAETEVVKSTPSLSPPAELFAAETTDVTSEPSDMFSEPNFN
jgi:hypothetical protein